MPCAQTVTGGVGGMGLTVAASILESGGDVILADLAEEPPAEPYAKLQSLASTHGTRISYAQCDVTSPSSISALFTPSSSSSTTTTSSTSPILTSRHPLRGLVTCAGTSSIGPTLSFPLPQLQSMISTNLTANYLCAQAAANEFVRTGSPGSIVLVASMSSHVANRGVDSAGYNATKAAVQQMARSMAAEWGCRADCPLIRVNSLSPGYIRTAATKWALDEEPHREKEWEMDNMLGRLSEVDEFRGPVTFLLADGSSFMTGADLRMDGGHTAW